MSDFKLTADGDLAVGQHAVDDEGNFLYYASSSAYSNGDITTEPLDGAVPIRDVDSVYAYDETLQWIQSIFRTDSPDWSLYPNLGANVSDFIGELNTQETATRIERNIIDSLTTTSELTEDDILVESIPISLTEIAVLIKLIKANQQTYDFNFVLNLELGVLNYYEIPGTVYR